MKLLAIGDNVVDCYLDQQKYYPGGNAVNVAVNCRRYGFGETAYLGIFGTDKKAEHLQACLRSEGVTFERSRQMVGRSGSPMVSLVEGDRVFVKSRKDTAQHMVRLNLITTDFHYIEGFDLVHSSCYSYLEPLLPEIRKRTQLSFDFSNKRRDDEYLKTVCPWLSFAFFSGAEMTQAEQDSLIDRCHALGTELVCITQGVKGSYFSYNGQQHRQGIVPVMAIDSLGAGDAFIAGFLTHFLIHGKDLQASAAFAAQKGAEACTYAGGWGYAHDFDGDEEAPEQ